MTAAEHSLVRDGAACLSGFPVRSQVLWLPHPARDGRALCSCTWVSEPLPTTQARRAAWTQHVKEKS